MTTFDIISDIDIASASKFFPDMIHPARLCHFSLSSQDFILKDQF
jgi:hypothetical protein